jgi:hypothetical protein
MHAERAGGGLRFCEQSRESAGATAWTECEQSDARRRLRRRGKPTGRAVGQGGAGVIRPGKLEKKRRERKKKNTISGNMLL